MRMLKEALRDILDEREIRFLYSSFDIIGDIAVIKIPDVLYEKRYIIGEAILRNVRSVRCVFMQKSPVQGDYRIRYLEHIAGENRTLTLYKEHGCVFKVDLAKVYFSPRLSTERARIASLVMDGEVIVNMFAGVCTFSIVIAKRHHCKVYSIDVNPHAYELCKENVRMNKLEDRVIPVLGDAKDVIIEQLERSADRVLMPLPEKAKEYIKYAILALRAGKECYIHYFTHINSDNKKDAGYRCSDEVDKLLREYDLKYSIVDTRVVREVSPRTYQVVSDISITKKVIG